MSTQFHSPEHLSPATAAPIRFVILYDEFASGLRGKHFAESLAARLDSSCEISESLWRSALLASPAIAAEADRAAAECDFFIVSLHGDHALPPATRGWIEAQLPAAAVRGAAVIALVIFGGETRWGGVWRAEGGARHHLRAACEEKDVQFFCHASTAGPDGGIPGLHPKDPAVPCGHHLAPRCAAGGSGLGSGVGSIR